MDFSSLFHDVSKYFASSSSSSTSTSSAASPSSRPHTSSSLFAPKHHPPSSSSCSTSQRMQRQFLGFHDVAVECVARGVAADEAGQQERAIGCYRQAGSIISEALLLLAKARGEGSEERGGSSFSSDVQQRKARLLSLQAQVNGRLRQLTASASPPPSNKHNSLVSRSFSSLSASTSHPPPTSSSSSSYHHSSSLPSSRDMAQQGGGKRGGGENVMRGVDLKMVEVVESEILDSRTGVKWDDVVGLGTAKQSLQEMVLLPMIRSDLFRGIRSPPRGLLLFGPPGNGKTMLAKAVAAASGATFFAITASSLTSKWMGDSEKLVRALFAVAIQRQPSIIFIDEIDSILSSRSSSEHEASRRLKTEFLVQFDGVASSDENHVVVIGATNRPQELDDAVRRRLVKRIFIPLPDFSGREAFLKKFLQGASFSVTASQIRDVAARTEGYSASDLKAVCQEAAMAPLRELGLSIERIKAEDIRKVNHRDVVNALSIIRGSASHQVIEDLEKWASQYGTQ